MPASDLKGPAILFVIQLSQMVEIIHGCLANISIKMDLQVPNPTKVSDGSARNYNEMEYLIIK
jgi:hypothetical protein